jgi:hypothetical protein
VTGRQRRTERRGVPWWTPLVVLAALAALVVAAALGQAHRPRHAVHTSAGGVLGAHTTLAVPARSRPVRHAVHRAAERSTQLQAGSRAAEHSVRVLAVVGPEIFWVGQSKARRTLVHLQGRGTRWGIRPGQRLTFVATVARNQAAAAARWGLTRVEGRDQFAHQATHFEVYGPRVRFLCVNRCS